LLSSWDQTKHGHESSLGLCTAGGGGLVKTTQMAQELLSWLQEMEAVNDLQEAFDVAEVLSDVLTDGTESAEQFVMEAERAGR
jgi:hypothetical protein